MLPSQILPHLEQDRFSEKVSDQLLICIIIIKKVDNEYEEWINKSLSNCQFLDFVHDFSQGGKH